MSEKEHKSEETLSGFNTYDEWIRLIIEPKKITYYISPKDSHPLVYITLILTLFTLVLLNNYFKDTFNLVLPQSLTTQNGLQQNKVTGHNQVAPFKLDLALKVFSNKNIFSMKKKPPPIAPRKPVYKGPKIKDKLRSFRLLGVIEGNPNEAIIESRKNRETYYLTAGDRLEEMEIETIQQGKVTFKFNNETGQLRS